MRSTSQRNLLGALIYFLFCSASAYSQTPAIPPPPICQSKSLEISIVSEVPLGSELKQHLLAVEIRNRGWQACALKNIVLRFPPEKYDQRVGWDSQTLKGGGRVHLLIAWSSVPRPTAGVIMNDCSTHEKLEAYWDWPKEVKPLLEIRSLQMESCGAIWNSLYREGSYTPGEPIDQLWLDGFHLKNSDFMPLAETAPGAAAELSLRPLSDVAYLAGAVGSGYSGYSELLVKLRLPAFANCPFHTLRKREWDGATVIQMNHCYRHGPGGDAKTNPKQTRIVIGSLGLLPERVGRVGYEVVSAMRRGDKIVLVSSQTEVSVRDPNQPMLPAIEMKAPLCRLAQLKLKTPVLELGAHWSEPRNYAAEGEEWLDGKVFELMNVSTATCLLGGVPNLKFLTPDEYSDPDPERKIGALRPQVCLNCGNPLFQPRDSRWIDLRPKESAHFIVVRRVLDSDFVAFCTVIGGLELELLPAVGETLRVPFDVGSCGPVMVSAWREGEYDNDPMNVRHDAEVTRKDQEGAKLDPPLPQQCSSVASEDTGLPVVFIPGGQDKLTWALSSKPSNYGDEAPVLLWLSNPTDNPLPVWTCQEIGYFWVTSIAIFDTAGHRVLSLAEEKQAKLRDSGQPVGLECLFVCSRNFPFDIAPHTCAHTTFSQPSYDFSHYLQTNYSLPPGKYVIVPAKRAQSCELFSTTPPANGGLPVTILQP